MGEYVLKMVSLGNGEKLPLLVSKSSMLGVFEAAVFAVHLRETGLKTKTIESAMRAVLILYEVLHERNISLSQRAAAGELLDASDITAIAERCKIRKDALTDPVSAVISLANVRRKKGRFARSKDEAVSPKSAALALHYIRSFLTHFSARTLLQRNTQKLEEFKQVSDLTLRTLKSKIPKVPRGSDRRGLPIQAEERLFEVIEPKYPLNCWKGEFLKCRNQLIVKLLIGLGVRKGELLGIKLDDVNIRNGLLFIAKRTNDAEDRRSRPATTKTLPRLLPLNDELVGLLLYYIDEVRPTRRLAAFSPYLIVSDEGNELSSGSIDYVFSQVRKAFPEFVKISAHVLRHTVNDRFAAMCEGMDKSLVLLTQNFLMGWGKGSKSAEDYTKAYVEKKGRELYMQLQGKMFK